MKEFSTHIDLTDLKSKLLHYSRQFDTCFFYDSNALQNVEHAMSFRNYDLLLALGKKKEIAFTKNKVFSQLQAFQNEHKTWLFGYLAYDLKNEIEALDSCNDDALQFPEAQFLEPQIIISLRGNSLYIKVLDEGFNAEDIAAQIIKISTLPIAHFPSTIVSPKTSQNDYIKAFQSLQKEIAYGNIYEINYCISFDVELKHQSYEALFMYLNEISNAPFSAFVKVNGAVIICASPERFIKKAGHQLVSQPIKGTAPRGSTPQEDAALKGGLLNNEKELSENVMITDLVRNDLSKHAARNTVKVDELFGIYSYTQVHQMISTVSAQLNNESDYINAIKDAFPMGSMTGAPKIMAMKLIEQHEQMKRGLYSGALGYIEPNNNYDFNVLIRSIFINSTNNKAQFCVGSAITSDANAEDEYRECLLKAAAMLKVLG